MDILKAFSVMFVLSVVWVLFLSQFPLSNDATVTLGFLGGLFVVGPLTIEIGYCTGWY